MWPIFNTNPADLKSFLWDLKGLLRGFTNEITNLIIHTKIFAVEFEFWSFSRTDCSLTDPLNIINCPSKMVGFRCVLNSNPTKNNASLAKLAKKSSSSSFVDQLDFTINSPTIGIYSDSFKNFEKIGP